MYLYGLFLNDTSVGDQVCTQTRACLQIPTHLPTHLHVLTRPLMRASRWTPPADAPFANLRPPPGHPGNTLSSHHCLM